jgi:small subunit ribosomal protein S6
MFVFDPGFAGELKNAEDEIGRLMDRAEGELVFCRKWDERKLAYEIDGRKRGVYLLTYFLADPTRIKPLERDAQLSEHILRLLVLRAEGIDRERMDHFAPPEEKAERAPAADDADAKPDKPETAPASEGAVAATESAESSGQESEAVS